MDFFGLDKAKKYPGGLELLTTVYDNVQLAVVRSLLEGAGIPFLAKERGAGGSVKIIAGFSMFGTDIYVRKEDLEAAAELLKSDADEEAGSNDNNNDDTSGDCSGI